MGLFRSILLIAAAAAGLAAGPPRSLAVAAASDLQAALPVLAAAFEARHPETTVRLSFGSSGTFTAQILHGAPYDLLFSADRAYTQRILEAGQGVPGSEFAYGRGRLVLWTRRDSGIPVATLGWKALTLPAVRRIALANPRHAPYGRAAEEALRSAGLLDVLRPRLVEGENIAQAAQFAQTGHADVGILALALALGPALAGSGTYWEIPEAAHGPLHQAGLLLRGGANPADAAAFRTFVLSPEGRGILARFGFLDGPP